MTIPNGWHIQYNPNIIADMQREFLSRDSQITALTTKLAEQEAELVKLRKVAEARGEYIEILEAECGDLTMFAVNHGWRSNRIEAGKSARARIDSALDEARAAG